MSQVTAVATPSGLPVTVAELLHQVGDVPAERVRLRPTPGTATEQDVLEACERKPLCELVDGTLVDKTVGTRESMLAAWIVQLIGPLVDEHDLGLVIGADGLFRMTGGNVRVPDAAVVLWDQFPEKKLPEDAVLKLSPALAVEVLSRSNTPREMQAKLEEYFATGTRMVWFIDPQSRTAEQFTSPTDGVQVDTAGSLTGGDVLPDLTLPLADVFRKL